MAVFWTRTRRYMAVLWLGTLAVEAVVLEMAKRTNDSWVLVLGAALLLVPLAAMARTRDWLGRAPRKRWKRHDVEAAALAAAREGRPPAEPPGERSGGWA
ncbi:MAG TPA: hypothetical protein VFQ76_21715 [Longimicrobiaceae bacterium]|nr:hypothetical protein [Longimicrobiaceae bacterium]